MDRRHCSNNRETPTNSYEEIHQIGDGAYGTVFKARDKSTGGLVALKKVKVALTEDGLPMNTLREIALLKQINTYEHPNIVRLLDICHGKRQEQTLVMYLVFEHVEQDLASFLNKYPKAKGLGTKKIVQMSREILNGVDFLHSHRIVHRDLKPQNLLVTHDGHLKLCDFGLAKTYDFEMKLTPVVVTLWYRAPEVLLGLPYATPVDIWSVGCIIAELYMFRPLFCGASESDQLRKILRVLGIPSDEDLPVNSIVNWSSFEIKEHIDLMHLIPSLCENGYDIIMKMLSFDPMKRIGATAALQHPYFTEEPLDT